MKKLATEIEVTNLSDQEVYHYVSELCAQLGGMRMEYERNQFTRGRREYSPAGSRQGFTQQHPPWVCADSCYHDEPYECFGGELVPYARPKAHYRSLCHYTITTCKRTCWKKNVVVCIREMIKSDRKLLSIHIAGECPYTHYKEQL